MASHNQFSRRTPAERLDLVAALRAFAKHALETTLDLTPRERAFLQDMTSRQDIRYGFGALDNLLQLAPRAANPHAFEEAIRGQVLRHRAPLSLSVSDTSLNETMTEGTQNLWQKRFDLERTSPMRDASLQATVQHLDMVRLYVDSLHVWSPAGHRRGT